ncbi:MAG: hypothetical protein AAF192_01240 [Pseudomonadota bacterium]
MAATEEGGDAVVYKPTDRGEVEGCALASCPFCGEDFAFTALVGLSVCDCGGVLSSIECGGCGAMGPLAAGGVEGAAEGWNLRAAAPVVQ